MTSRIYRECIQLCRDCAPLIKQIARYDRNLADQLRRAVTSVPFNVSESDGRRGGNRLQRRLTVLGSARETGSCLEIAEAVGYIGPLDAVANRVNHVIGALVLMTR